MLQRDAFILRIVLFSIPTYQKWILHSLKISSDHSPVWHLKDLLKCYSEQDVAMFGLLSVGSLNE